MKSIDFVSLSYAHIETVVTFKQSLLFVIMTFYHDECIYKARTDAITNTCYRDRYIYQYHYGRHHN